MTGARQAILDRIRRANAGRASPRPPSHPLPARAQGDAATLRPRFLEHLEFAGASHVIVPDDESAAQAAAAFLTASGVPAAAVISADPALRDYDWGNLSVRVGAPGPDDRVSITGAVAGIAETGTLMVRSGPDISAKLYFLPEIHIAVLPVSAICGSYEDAFSRLGALPRTVTLITGPSRSSDIERILQIGVHGPRALHVIVIDDR